MNLRDKIFEADDIDRETVEIPEWGVSIEVRTMTGADRGLLMEAAVDQDTGGVRLQRIYPDAVILSAYDPETGERVFRDEDRDGLLAKSGKAVDRLAAVAMRLSGFEAGAVDAAGKDSSTSPSDATSSS